MVKYHNTPNGPRLCRATIRDCIYTAEGQNHFSTQQEAQKFYEQSLKESFGTLRDLKRTRTEKMRQSTYRKIDFVSEKVDTVRSSAKAIAEMKQLKAVRSSVASKARTGLKLLMKSYQDTMDVVRMNQAMYKAHREHRREQFNKLKNNIKTELAAQSKTQDTAKNIRNRSVRKVTPQELGKVKPVKAYDIKPGDYTSDGDRVTSIYHGDKYSVVETLNDKTGQSDSINIEGNSSIGIRRASRFDKVKQKLRQKRIGVAMDNSISAIQRRRSFNRIKQAQLVQNNRKFAVKLPEYKGNRPALNTPKKDDFYMAVALSAVKKQQTEKKYKLPVRDNNDKNIYTGARN